MASVLFEAAEISPSYLSLSVLWHHVLLRLLLQLSEKTRVEGNAQHRPACLPPRLPVHPQGESNEQHLLLLVSPNQILEGRGKKKNAYAPESMSFYNLLVQTSPLTWTLPLFSSKPSFKTSPFAKSKDTGPGGRRLDSSYRSAFDLLCDLEQVTAPLWSFISPSLK